MRVKDLSRTASDLTYSPDGLNRYTGASFTYDANGNLTSDSANTFVYDVENRLVSRSGAASATLRYDPLGRLYEVVGSTTRRFLYDRSDLIAEYDGSGTMQRRYVHGLSPGDDVLVQFFGYGTADINKRMLYADERGSTILVTDSTGERTSHSTYDEYGVRGSTNSGDFQYTGQMWLPELGMYYYKARMYSPLLGRFMQTDPIGYGDGMNMYAYVGNDPANFADPSGLAGEQCTSVSWTLRQTPGGDSITFQGQTREAEPKYVLVPTITVVPCNSNYVESGDGPNQSRGGHEYWAERRVCKRPLTPEESSDLISRYTVPNFRAGTPKTDGTNVVTLFFIPAGIVTTRFLSNGQVGMNTTTPFHGTPPIFLTPSLGVMMIREVSDGQADIYSGVQA